MDATGPRIKKGGECPWCYGIGGFHSPECRVMLAKSSLQTQRSKTEQLRGEMYATAARRLSRAGTFESERPRFGYFVPEREH